MRCSFSVCYYYPSENVAVYSRFEAFASELLENLGGNDVYRKFKWNHSENVLKKISLSDFKTVRSDSFKIAS